MRDLTKENNGLRDMLDGYENRQRRTNLRVLGVAEDSERGKCPLKFMSELLVKVLNDDSLSKAPELERCHRAPMPKPSPDANPSVHPLLSPLSGERARPATGYTKASALLRGQENLYLPGFERSAGGQAQRLQEGKITVL